MPRANVAIFKLLKRFANLYKIQKPNPFLYITHIYFLLVFLLALSVSVVSRT